MGGSSETTEYLNYRLMFQIQCPMLKTFRFQPRNLNLELMSFELFNWQADNLYVTRLNAPTSDQSLLIISISVTKRVENYV